MTFDLQLQKSSQFFFNLISLRLKRVPNTQTATVYNQLNASDIVD